MLTKFRELRQMHVQYEKARQKKELDSTDYQKIKDTVGRLTLLMNCTFESCFDFPDTLVLVHQMTVEQQNHLKQIAERLEPVIQRCLAFSCFCSSLRN